ncbi:hypothetical protein EON64_07070 [archaeon]|nr:MAG: hypothetical protein EON64_07070 [archaeon]
MKELTDTMDPQGARFFASPAQDSSRTILPALSTEYKQNYSEAQGQGMDLRRKPSAVPIKEEVLKAAVPPSKRQASPVHSASTLPKSSPSATNGDVEELLERARRHIDELDKVLSNNASNKTTSPKASASAGGRDVKDETDMESLIGSMGSLFIDSQRGDRVKDRQIYEGMVIIIDLLCATYRHLKYLSSRTLCILLVLRLGKYCPDNVILQRIVPILLVGLDDHNTLIKVLSLRSLTSLLSQVSTPDVSLLNYFPNYLFPYFNKVMKESDVTLRTTFAECLGTLSCTAKRFLEKAHIAYVQKQFSEVNNDMQKMAIDFPYDSKLEWLREQFSRWIRDLIIDSSQSTGNNPTMKNRSQVTVESSVKKGILHSMQSLCTFFGQEYAMEKILTQALTFLGDMDWDLRAMFCSLMPPVGAFLGSTITSEYILPCMEQTLYDIEDRVVHAFLTCLHGFFTLQLLSKSLVIEYVRKTKALAFHPNPAIVSAEAELIACTRHCLSPADMAVYILPELKELLHLPVVVQQISKENITRGLRSPVPNFAWRKTLFTMLDTYAASIGSNVKIGEIFGEKKTSSMSMKGKELFEQEVKEIGSKELQDKLELCSGYMNSLSKEIFNKSIKWRLLYNSNYMLLVKQNVTRNLALSAVPSIPRDTLAYFLFDNLLDYSQVSLSENSVNVILIPLMKHVSYVSEEVRRTNVNLQTGTMGAAETRNLQNIKALYIGNNYAYDIFRGSKAAGEVTESGVEGQLSLNTGGDAHNRTYSQLNTDSINIMRRIRALRIPPLPVDMGTLVSEEARTNEEGTSERGGSGTPPGAWRPSQNVLFMTLREHTAAVNRLVVSPDQQFFCSASSDCTVRVWQSRNLDKSAFPRLVHYSGKAFRESY